MQDISFQNVSPWRAEKKHFLAKISFVDAAKIGFDFDLIFPSGICGTEVALLGKYSILKLAYFKALSDKKN